MKSAVATQSSVQADSGRIASRFAELKANKQAALVAFVVAGDPDIETTAQLLAGLPNAGADIIELSMPFSDPMADGPTIQAANMRALTGGISLVKTLDLVRRFREKDQTTPIVLMGYYNPIYVYGVEKFLCDAKQFGVDGLITVDLPPEEDNELCIPAMQQGLNFIRLITPTTDAKRLPVVLKNASGFLYYVSVAGITGAKTANADTVGAAIAQIRPHSDLPVAIGFGISTPDQARAMAKHADGVIVGSAIVNRIAANLDTQGKAKNGLVQDVLDFVAGLAKAAHNG